MKQYRVSESVRSTHNQDGAVVLDICLGQIFQLNSVGSLIFELLQENLLSEGGIIHRVSNGFNIAPEIVTNDVREFLQALVQHDLIEQIPTVMKSEVR